MNSRPLALALLLCCSCAAVYGQPGTHSGGPYCLQRGGEPDACYADEAARSRALSDQQAKDRAESERAEQERRAAQKAELDTVLTTKAEEARLEEVQHQAYLARADEKDRLELEAREAKAARAAQVHLLASDRLVAGRAISGILCTIDAELVRLRERLDREKRATKLSSVRNLTARDSIASEIVEDEDEIKAWKASLKRLGALQTSCAELGDGVYACRLDRANCTEADREAGDVWRLELQTLWGSDRQHPQR